MKVNNLRLRSAFFAIVVAGGMTLGTINDCYAETHYKQGTFINETITQEEENYNQYVVKEGDTLSKISVKICRYFKEKVSEKYWPALAFLNNYPKTSKPGDIIVFPETFEKLETLNDNLRSAGWTARYIQRNKIYGKKKSDNITDYNIKSLLEEIYGDYVTVDDEFIKSYLQIHNLDHRYSTESLQEIDTNKLFELTEWIPTIQEITEFEIARNEKRK